MRLWSESVVLNKGRQINMWCYGSPGQDWKTIFILVCSSQIPHIKIGPEETPRLPYLRFASVTLYPSNEDLSLAIGAILRSFSYPTASLICAKAECKSAGKAATQSTTNYELFIVHSRLSNSFHSCRFTLQFTFIFNLSALSLGSLPIIWSY